MGQCGSKDPSAVREPMSSPAATAAARQLHVQADKAALSKALAAFVAEASATAIKETGKFSVAFSGGSLAKILGSSLLDVEGVEWAKWHVFFADERCVPLGHEDSNFRLVNDNFLSKTSIPKDQIFAIDPTLDAKACAEDYERRLVADLGEAPKIHLLLLGMGPDGHTCSLFPQHKLLKEESTLVTHITDSPKPPPNRITLTFKAIRAAHAAAFVCAGEGKAEKLKQVFEEEIPEGDLPAKMVTVDGVVHWFMDQPAVGQLSAATLKGAAT